MTIKLPRTLTNQILHHAQSHPEDEVCGLVSARDGHACRIYPVANTAGNPATRFQMDPRQQIDAMRRIREAGEKLFAIYHSHPHAPAEPSAEDLRQAAYPDAVYLIVSLNTEGVLEMRGFRLTGGTVWEVELETVENNHPSRR